MKSFYNVCLLIIILIITSSQVFSKTDNPPSDKYLLVLDLQDYYLKNSLNNNEAEAYISMVNELISKTKKENIIYIKSTHKVLNLSLKPPFIYVTLDTSAMQLNEKLSIVNQNIFIKEKPNDFSVDELTEFLKSKNVEEIIIVGLLAEECVYKTSIGGLENNYDVFIVPHAILGKSEKSKNKKIEKLREKGVNILDISYF